MARNEGMIDAGIDTVFAVLGDPRTYEHSVVGTKQIRRFDPNWPDPGSMLHHSVGFGPLVRKDVTTSIAIDPPHRLVLRPQVRPFVVLETVFTLSEEAGGTRLVVDEYPVGGALARVWLPPFEWMIAARNAEVLRRIATFAERRDAVTTAVGR